jgi:hypothetical protein
MEEVLWKERYSQWSVSGVLEHQTILCLSFTLLAGKRLNGMANFTSALLFELSLSASVVLAWALLVSRQT